MKDSAEQIIILCRRPVGQRGYSHKALSLIREWRPLNRERRRSALSLGGTGRGAYPNNPRPNTASYDIAKRSYR